ncbi:MAG: hypothetical protein V1921_01650 [Candidatus Altiarchaeota archaeon]
MEVKMHNRIGKIWVFFAVLVLAGSATAISIGAGPSSLDFQKMVRGGYSQKFITVSTAGDDNLTITLDVEGEINDWMTFEPGREFNLPGRSRLEVKAIVQPPEEIANGVYTGKIQLRAAPVSEVTEGTGFSVGAGVRLSVTVDITGEEIVDYKVKSVTVSDTEVGYPVRFNITLENLGNVKVQPSVTFEVYADPDKQNVLQTLEYSDLEILPTTTKSGILEIPTENMPVGRYWTDVTSDIGGVQTLTFDVLEPGTLAIKGNLEQVKLSKIWVSVDEIVKVEARFRNEGELLIENAKFIGEAYLIDEKYNTEQLLGVFESAPASVPVNEDVLLISYFTPKRDGRYSIRGYVQYSGKKSYEKGSVLNVQAQPKNYIYHYIGVGLVVLLLVYYLIQKGSDGRTRRFKRLWRDYLSLK